MTQKEMTKALRRAVLAYEIAFNNRERASWHSGTTTARKELARYDARREEAERLVWQVIRALEPASSESEVR